MAHLNYEFKAKMADNSDAEDRLKALIPRFIGEDSQADTYFNIPRGRLKLREGIIENALIYYERPDTPGAKTSHVILYQHQPDKGLKDILVAIHGVKTIVEKTRRIYFIENVKFHFDEVKGLGRFLEVEAIDQAGNIGISTLKKQCEGYAHLFKVDQNDYISCSYADLMLTLKER